MLEVDYYYDTGSLPSASWKTAKPSRANGWYRKPSEGTQLVCVGTSLQWASGTPALITVKEILADNTFLTFNQTTVPPLIASTTTSAGITNRVKVPCLFYPVNDVRGTYAVAYTPNTANLQWVNSNPANAKPFGPRNTSNVDVLEQAIQGALPGQSTFLDDWNSFHTQMGEVHCGSAAERTAETQWWNK